MSSKSEQIFETKKLKFLIRVKLASVKYFGKVFLQSTSAKYFGNTKLGLGKKWTNLARRRQRIPRCWRLSRTTRSSRRWRLQASRSGNISAERGDSKRKWPGNY